MKPQNNWHLYSPSALISEAKELQILQLVLNQYCSTLLSESEALEFLLSKKGIDEQVVKQFNIGFVDRSLPQKMLKLPSHESEEITGRNDQKWTEEMRWFADVLGHDYMPCSGPQRPFTWGFWASSERIQK